MDGGWNLDELLKAHCFQPSWYQVSTIRPVVKVEVATDQSVLVCVDARQEYAKKLKRKMWVKQLFFNKSICSFTSGIFDVYDGFGDL